MSRGEKKKSKQKTFLTTLIAGGSAGAADSLICHPLDTIKTRLQLQNSAGRGKGIVTTAKNIVRNEGFFSLYKGLSAVFTGIVPKMAIRYSSFERLKYLFTANQEGGLASITVCQTLIAGTMSGTIEAILVVTPLEVLKIRLQAQTHSMTDPNSQARAYRNVGHAAICIIRDEGVGALYKGVIPTVLRQASNQAVNFTVYDTIKKQVLAYYETDHINPLASMLIGGISGGIAPCCNAPLDVAKTRLQKQRIIPGQPPKYNGVIGCLSTMYREEGIRSFYKGLLPRLMRISPGQAITFMTYETVSKQLVAMGMD